MLQNSCFMLTLSQYYYACLGLLAYMEIRTLESKQLNFTVPPFPGEQLQYTIACYSVEPYMQPSIDRSACLWPLYITIILCNNCHSTVHQVSQRLHTMSIPFGPLPFEMHNQLQILMTAMQHVAIIQVLIYGDALYGYYVINQSCICTEDQILNYVQRLGTLV